MTKSFLWASGLVSLLVTFNVNAQDDAVEAFKKHLSSPPCFSKILYSEASCNDTVSQSFHAAYCGNSFFLRSLTGKENIDLPVSNTNRNRSTLYVGRLGDTRWQIADYQTTISILPDILKPDPYTDMSDSLQMSVGGIISLSSQHILPGTFVWSGNKFICKGTRFAAQFGYSEFHGEIVVEGGFVTKMTIPGAGMWGYKYSQSPNIPFGLPSEIISLGPHDVCLSKVLVQAMIVGNPSDELSIFDPKGLVDSSLAVPRVLSNSVEIVSGQVGDAVFKLEQEGDADAARKVQAGLLQRPGKRIAVLVILLVVSLGAGLAITFMRSKSKP